LHQVKIDSSFKIVCEDPEDKEISIECTNKRGESSLWKLSFPSRKATQTWLGKLRKAARPIWATPNSKNCTVCQKNFKTFRRQHHCRKCGKVMCSKHTKKVRNLEELGYEGKVKVCTNCFSLLKNPKRSKSMTMKDAEKQEFADSFIRAYQSRSVLEF